MMKYQITCALLCVLNTVPMAIAREPNTKLLRSSARRLNVDKVKTNEDFGNLDANELSNFADKFGLDSRMLQLSMSMPVVPTLSTTTGPGTFSTDSVPAPAPANLVPVGVIEPEPRPEPKPEPAPAPFVIPAPVVKPDPVVVVDPEPTEPVVLPVIDSTTPEATTQAKPSEQNTDTANDLIEDDYYEPTDDYYYYDDYYYEQDVAASPVESPAEEPETVTVSPPAADPAPEITATPPETADVSEQASPGASDEPTDTSTTSNAEQPAIAAQEKTVEVVAGGETKSVNMGAIIGVSVGALLALGGAGYLAKKRFAADEPPVGDV